ncbi:hypothetical protein B0O99DRAFT_607821 [Bisporella sp. PMI_857]|nr:hypothetical protein B0O99DRAFT_607821 [Bisporella sp. PMI_857]
MGNSRKPSDLSRAERKNKKRQLEDAVPDLPGDEDMQVDDGGGKPSKKRKREMLGGDDVEKRIRTEVVEGKKSASGGEAVEDAAEQTDEAPRKSKKERKAERKAKEAAEAKAAKENPPARPEEEEEEQDERGEQGEDMPIDAEKPKARKNNRNREKKRKAAAEGPGKEPRFIVFIGNLPFTATTASVTQHFAKVRPRSVRHITEKNDPRRSKGIAFLEFEGYDHMKTCLKLFHHSMFDDGVSPARRINVELTVGGGGNSKERKSKIGEKNQRLNEQRERRIVEEQKVKKEKSADKAGVAESSVHPSRRGHIPGA